MRQPRTAASSVLLLLLALAVTGCGSSLPSTPNVAAISFSSPAIQGTAIPARYTCDGKNITPPLEWGSVPSGINELALVMIAYIPNAAKNSVAISPAWAMAGINPKLRKLAAGEVPPGAHIGLDETGATKYSICPPKGTERRYQFTLYAVPLSVKVPATFVDSRLFNLIATGNAQYGAIAAGAFLASYKR